MILLMFSIQWGRILNLLFCIFAVWLHRSDAALYICLCLVVCLLQQYPAENLLKNDSFKKWKCAAGEKQASVVFQVQLAVNDIEQWSDICLSLVYDIIKCVVLLGTGRMFNSLSYDIQAKGRYTAKSVMPGQCDVTFPTVRHCCPLVDAKLYCLMTEADAQSDYVKCNWQTMSFSTGDCRT